MLTTEELKTLLDVPRFWNKVNKTPEGCWLWTAATMKAGYGAFSVTSDDGRVVWYSHRASWIIHNGPIPDGLFVCHECDVRRCVNPKHLFLGTQKDNLVDMSLKGRSAKGKKNPHLTGERHNLAKLSNSDVVQIIEILATGNRDYRAIGKLFGVTRTAVYSIATRKTWTHMTLEGNHGFAMRALEECAV